jgi:hypothetical protein
MLIGTALVFMAATGTPAGDAAADEGPPAIIAAEASGAGMPLAAADRAIAGALAAPAASGRANSGAATGAGEGARAGI